MYEFGERAYTRYIVVELIKKIRSESLLKDPLTTVYDFIVDIDVVGHRSNNSVTKQFCMTVVRILDDIHQFMWEDEIKRKIKKGEGVF